MPGSSRGSKASAKSAGKTTAAGSKRKAKDAGLDDKAAKKAPLTATTGNARMCSLCHKSSEDSMVMWACLGVVVR